MDRYTIVTEYRDTTGHWRYQRVHHSPDLTTPPYRVAEATLQTALETWSPRDPAIGGSQIEYRVRVYASTQTQTGELLAEKTGVARTGARRADAQ